MLIFILMISWREFSRYTLPQKVNALYAKGTFIMGIRYYRYKVNLYTLGEDFVEVFINHKLAAVEKVIKLDHTHTRMKFYYDQIKLPNNAIRK